MEETIYIYIDWRSFINGMKSMGPRWPAGGTVDETIVSIIWLRNAFLGADRITSSWFHLQSVSLRVGLFRVSLV